MSGNRWKVCRLVKQVFILLKRKRESFEYFANLKASEYRSIIKWFSPLSFFKTQDDYFGKRVEGTGQWFLDSGRFRAWLDSANGILWCPGIRTSSFPCEKKWRLGWIKG